MKYEAWTAPAIRDRILEAAMTIRRLPKVMGPKMYGNALPEPVRRYDDAYGYSEASTKKRASGVAISRMEKTFEWINAYLCEDDRKLVYGWSAVKVRKGMSIAKFAEENKSYERMMRREILRCCQIIANELNRLFEIRLDKQDCRLSENAAQREPTTVSSKNRVHGITHWSDADAKPQIDTGLPEKRLLEPRAIRARHSDRNRSLGVKA